MKPPRTAASAVAAALAALTFCAATATADTDTTTASPSATATTTAPATTTTTTATSTTAPTSTTTATTTAPSSTTTAVAADPNCAPLHVLIANGTGESRPDIDTSADSGFGSAIVVPAALRANTGGRNLLSRSYIPYNPGGGPFANKSIDAGLAAARATLTDLSTHCPNQKVMLLGHLQGAQLMASLAREIAAGKGAILADRVAGVALFSDPTRPTGQAIFTGTGPAQIPGSRTHTVTNVRLGTVTASTGGGLSPSTDKAGFGSLAGRVAEFCNPGDITCDVPADAAIVRLIGNLAASSKLDPADPIGALTSVGSAVGQSILYAGSSLVNDTLNFKDGKLQVTASDTTVMDRMLTASNPNARPGEAVTTAIRALAKVAGMGMNALITVGKSVISADTIAQVGAAGLADPAAGLAVLGVKLADAAIKLINPVAILSVGQQVFTEIQRGIVDNAGLVQIMLDTRYFNLGAARGSYDSVPLGANGQSAVALTTDWIATAAADLAPAPPTNTTTSAPTTSASAPGPVLATPNQTVLTAAQILGNGQDK